MKIQKKYLKFFSANLMLFLSIAVCAQTPKFTFNFNGTPPAGFAACFTKAGENWANSLNITVPVKVNVFTINSSAIPFSGITFANGVKNFQNAPKQNFAYVTSLANQLAGQELNPGTYDMDIYINLATPLYYGTGACPSNALDMITLAMHEMGHGLGFYSTGYVNGSGQGSFGNIPATAIFPISTSFPWPGTIGVPTIYDFYLEQKSGTKLYQCAAQNSNALGDSIKNGPKYFNGPVFANLTNSSQRIKVQSGNGSFNLGDDLLHLDPIFPDAMMSASFGYGDTIRTPVAIEMGILKEIGWNPSGTTGLTNLSTPAKTIKIQPNPVSSSVRIESENMVGWRIFDQFGRIISENESALEVNTEVYINTAEFKNGIYILKVKSENQGEISAKIIVLH